MRLIGEHRDLKWSFVRAASVALLMAASTVAKAGLVESDLTFSSTDQSMWGPGTALQYDKTQFFGATWNESGSIGGFVGGDSAIINPLWLAWYICPFLCGSEPTKYFYVDTTTGLQASATTQGKIGFELGLTMDSGSMDASVGYNTSIFVPEVGDLTPGQFVSLNPGSTLTGNSLQSQFPTMSASLSVVMEVSATFAVTGCALGACDTASFSTGQLGGTQELISFNEDGEGGIEYFGGSGLLSDALDAAVDLGLVELPTGFPAELEIPVPAGLGRLGTITAYLPEPNASGGLNAAGTALVATGQDDLLDISLDVDNIISVAATGFGGLFGGDQDLGAGFGISYDLINVELGPQIDLVQSFEFTPTLLVDLEFSQPVDVTGYGMVSSLSGLNWDLLPTMAFAGGVTTITPTFYLGATIDGALVKNAGELFNQLFLDIDGNVTVDLLTASFNTPFGDLSLGIGNLINESFDLFSTPAFFDTRFAMGGFSPVSGQSFDVRVPEPGSLLLFALGLMGLAIVRRRRSPVLSRMSRR